MGVKVFDRQNSVAIDRMEARIDVYRQNIRWIDVYENVGKRSGAYSAGTRKHPYVLLNHNNDLNTEFTLAHEMGHALHSYLQPQAARGNL